jgi:hypothetical protein
MPSMVSAKCDESLKKRAESGVTGADTLARTRRKGFPVDEQHTTLTDDEIGSSATDESDDESSVTDADQDDETDSSDSDSDSDTDSDTDSDSDSDGTDSDSDGTDT